MNSACFKLLYLSVPANSEHNTETRESVTRQQPAAGRGEHATLTTKKDAQRSSCDWPALTK